MATTANTLTNIIPKVLARGMAVLRERCVMPRLVLSDFGIDPAFKGSTIDIPIPSSRTVSDVTPAETQPAPEATTPTLAQVTMSYWRKANFHLSDSDLMKIAAGQTFIPGEMDESIRALANDINAKILGCYNQGVYGWVGTGGTAPFGSGRLVQDAIDAMGTLNKQLAPMRPRYGVLDWTAYNGALGVTDFREAYKRGSSETMTTGDIGFVLGADWMGDDAVPYHTKGTLSNGSGMLAKVNEVAHAVGDTTVDIDETTLTGTLVDNDVFTVAGDTQTYAVTNGTLTAAANAIAGVAHLPAAKVAWADDAVVTFKGSYRVNLAFHRDAFAFANRPLADESMLGSPNIQTMRDPVSGIVLRLEVIREHKQTVWELDVLYGVALIDARKACIIAG